MDTQGNTQIPLRIRPRRRKRSSTERKWPRRFLKPISFFLTTGNETDTVDRLFVSKHVNDLRLITASVFVILILVTVLAVVVAMTTAIVDPVSGGHVTGAQRLLDSSTAAGGVFLKLFVPTFAVFGAVLTWAYQAGSARLGVVDLFACEIDTLCRVITVIDMVGTETSRYTIDPSKCSPDGKDKTASPGHFNSQEEYFPILANNSRDLQTLEANVVVNITAFYTFMKALRDTLRQLADAKSMKQWQESMRNVIYMLYLGLESGRNAMNDLVEFEPTHTERTMVILISELDAYYFLRDKFRDPSEMRNDRLILRGPVYTALVPKINEVLNCKAKGPLEKARRGETPNPTYEDSQWLAALQLRDSLNTRFDRLKRDFPLECFAIDDRIVTAKISAV
jgi:hypothetical protein